MNKFILFIILIWQISAYAESDEMQSDHSWLDEVYNSFSPGAEAPAPEAPAASNESQFSHPPPPPSLSRQSKPEKETTEYYSAIKPGDKLPDDVYECALKNIQGIGSDTAAAMVWQSCLRLHLE